MKNHYDNERKSWDKFKAFYSTENHFVSFETGEVRLDTWRFEPHERKFYEKYDITLAATGDQDNIIYLHPSTGKQIPRAQLTYGGMQYIVVDHNTKRAVGLQDVTGSGHKDDYKKLPKHLQGANVWTANSDQKVHGNAIRVNAPTVITPEMEAWKKTVEVLAKMRGSAISKPSNYWEGQRRKNTLTDTKLTPYEYVEKCLDKNFTYSLSAFHQINDHGIEFTRDPQPLEFLMVDFKK